MITKLICSAITGCVGLYDLYEYTVCDPNDSFRFIWLAAGILCLCGSAYIFCSEED